MAESVGVRGIRLENPGEVESGIADALAHDGPVLTGSAEAPERALGVGRLKFGWHLPFHVAQTRDARAL
jgi:hypothetical protein